ncbi:MAG: ABC transporter permease [Rhodovibrionaceae bacterium]
MSDVAVSPADLGGPTDVRKVSALSLVLRSPGGLCGIAILSFFAAVAALGPWITFGDHMEVHYLADGSVARLLTPAQHGPLGTDYYGRDIYTQLALGTRTALLVSIVSTMFMAIVGTNIGLFAAYYGGRIESVLMRITDLAFSVPFLPFAIILVVLLEPSLWNIIITISCLMWRTTARVIRAQSLSVKQRTYVKAAKVAGASDLRIIFVHIFPNVLPLSLLYVAFGISWAVLSEASLSFLGFGDPKTVSWGQMLYNAYISGSIRTAWWWTIPPGLCLTLFVISVFLVGRELERYINPKLW